MCSVMWDKCRCVNTKHGCCDTKRPPQNRTERDGTSGGRPETTAYRAFSPIIGGLAKSEDDPFRMEPGGKTVLQSGTVADG